MQPLADLVADGLCTVAEAAAFLGVSRTFLYSEMDAGRLVFAKLGRARRLPRRALMNYAASRLTSSEERHGS